MACQIDDHCQISILPIQSQDDSSQGIVLLGGIEGENADQTQQLPPVIPIACIAEGGEPLLGVREQQGGRGADNFTSFSPSISRCTDKIHTSVSRGKIG